VSCAVHFVVELPLPLERRIRSCSLYFPLADCEITYEFITRYFEIKEFVD
jgi:hypothetical protein